MEAINSWSTYDLDNATIYSERGLKSLSSVPDEKQYPFLRFGMHGKDATQDLQCMKMANMDMRERDTYNRLVLSIVMNQNLQTQASKSAELF